MNLAVQMQKMGKRVLVFDADFGLANVEVMFGAIPKYNLADVIYHGKQITEIISEGKTDLPQYSVCHKLLCLPQQISHGWKEPISWCTPCQTSDSGTETLTENKNLSVMSAPVL